MAACLWTHALSGESGRAQRHDLNVLRALGFAALFAAGALQGGCTETHGPSTPDERARFVALVRLLESDPLADNANSIRQQLRDWATEVPDIKFKVCPSLLDGAIGNYRYSRELTLQVMLSGAVLTIEDAGRARDDARVYTAGVEGALRAYGVLVNSTSDGRSAVLDDLVEKRDRGELFDHIAQRATEKCPKSSAPLIAAPLGAAAGLLLALLVTYLFGGRGASGPAQLTSSDTMMTTSKATTVRKIVLSCAAYYTLAGIALHLLHPNTTRDSNS